MLDTYKENSGGITWSPGVTLMTNVTKDFDEQLQLQSTNSNILPSIEITKQSIEKCETSTRNRTTPTLKVSSKIAFKLDKTDEDFKKKKKTRSSKMATMQSNHKDFTRPVDSKIFAASNFEESTTTVKQAANFKKIPNQGKDVNQNEINRPRVEDFDTYKTRALRTTPEITQTTQLLETREKTILQYDPLNDGKFMLLNIYTSPNCFLIFSLELCFI